jgi:polar amino acid transport system substrate-binding protein
MKIWSQQNRSAVFSRCTPGLLTCLLTLLPQLACAADLTLYYYDRPPYMKANASGGPSGYLIERTERVLKKAGISFEWQLSSVNRIFVDLKEGRSQMCSPGWYTSPERRKFASFTKSIYHDLPLVGLVRSDSPIAENTTAAAVLSQPGIVVLRKESVVYGAYLDSLLDKMSSANILRTSTDFPNSVRMIYARRADMAIVAQEEIDTFIKNVGLERSEFKLIYFSDEPALGYRHILCSRAVDPDLISKMDDAITALGLP